MSYNRSYFNPDIIPAAERVEEKRCKECGGSGWVLEEYDRERAPMKVPCTVCKIRVAEYQEKLEAGYRAVREKLAECRKQR